MIRLTRMNHEEFFLNVAVIASVEGTPDTLVVLTNGDRVHVREPVADVIAEVYRYHRRVATGDLQPTE